jgi:hypothetical protein
LSLGSRHSLVRPGDVGQNHLAFQVDSLGPAREGSREPFALKFWTADGSVRLRQHIYAVSHPSLGRMEVFLVQIRAYFEAVFN